MFKKISIFFLLMANILILAHPALHHHHHEGEVCFVTTHCTDDHSGSEESEGHSHDSDDSTYCAFKQAAIIPANSTRENSDHKDELSGKKNPQDMRSVIPVSIDYIPENCCLSDYSPIYKITSRYSFVLNHCMGLRAPPSS